MGLSEEEKYNLVSSFSPEDYFFLIEGTIDDMVYRYKEITKPESSEKLRKLIAIKNIIDL